MLEKELSKRRCIAAFSVLRMDVGQRGDGGSSSIWRSRQASSFAYDDALRRTTSRLKVLRSMVEPALSSKLAENYQSDLVDTCCVV
jgi:hypothetical protein